MATYLIQVLTGDYEIVDGVGPNGLPLLSVVLRHDRATMQPYLDTIDDQIDFFDDYFGPYPLDRYGIAITDSCPGLAMETMERSLFSRGDFSTGRLDTRRSCSSPTSWPTSGSAMPCRRRVGTTCGSTRASPRTGSGCGSTISACGRSSDSAQRGAGRSATRRRRRLRRSDEMFGFNSYDGGAVVLHALRQTIGDDLFFTLLQPLGGRQQRHVAHDRRLRRSGRPGRRPGPDRVLRRLALRRRAAGRRSARPGLVADEVLEDLAAPLLGLAGALLVAVGADRQAQHRVDAEPAQWLRLPLAGLVVDPRQRHAGRCRAAGSDRPACARRGSWSSRRRRRSHRPTPDRRPGRSRPSRTSHAARRSGHPSGG